MASDTQIDNNQFDSLKNLEKLPKNINISTITLTCKINTKFNVINIGKYIKLSKCGICSVEYKNEHNVNSVRSLLYKKKKKKKRAFYNQATLEIYKENSKGYMNIKLFNNGSIQMTGCRGLQDFVNVINLLCKELNKSIGILVDMKTFIHKPFMSEPNYMCIDGVEDIRIRMINTNFRLNHHVDREILYNILKLQGIDCRFEPNKHACVNIKRQCKNNTVSIFVFEKGSVIITAARNYSQIISSYEFINKIISERKEEVTKKDVVRILSNISLSDLESVVL